jgi:hypothetical protein
MKKIFVLFVSFIFSFSLFSQNLSFKALKDAVLVADINKVKVLLENGVDSNEVAIVGDVVKIAEELNEGKYKCDDKEYCLYSEDNVSNDKKGRILVTELRGKVIFNIPRKRFLETFTYFKNYYFGLLIINNAKKNNILEINNILNFNEDVNLNVFDTDKHTALHWASMKGNVLAVKTLLEYEDLKIDTKDIKEMTPLHWAVFQTSRLAINREKYKKIIMLLINNGANVKALNLDSMTVLHMATFSNDLDLIKFLFSEKEKDFSEILNSKNSPMEIALKYNFKNIVNYFNTKINN